MKSLFQFTGTCHCNDLFHMLQTTVISEAKPDTRNFEMIVLMWSQFAKTSSNHYQVYSYWPQTEGKLLLNIGSKLQVIPFPESHRMAFWNELDVMTRT